MKCMHCQGKMKKGFAPFHADRKGYHVSWDAVPSWVCCQCGEPYFEESEVNAIQKALVLLDKKSDFIMQGRKSLHTSLTKLQKGV